MKSRVQRTRYSNDKSVASSAHSSISERKELDQQYLQLREIICNTEFYQTTTRHNRIRFNLWSQKLDQIVADVPWKRNRNNYIKLMYLMAQSDVLVEPFASLPPEGDLPFLRNYEINAIVDLVESKVNEKIAKFGYCRHCQQLEKERNIPFRLSTARIDSMEEEYTYTQSLAFCSHPCMHLLNKTAENGKLLINYQSKTTVGFTSFEQNQQECYIYCEQYEKQNKNGNKLNQNLLKNTKKLMARTALQDRTQINIPHHTNKQMTKRQSESSSDVQGDLDQRVSIPTVRVFSSNPISQHML